MQSYLQLKYFRGNEAESFTFYRIPKMLVKHERFKSISTESMFLYGDNVILGLSLMACGYTAGDIDLVLFDFGGGKGRRRTIQHKHI